MKGDFRLSRRRHDHRRDGYRRRHHGHGDERGGQSRPTPFEDPDTLTSSGRTPATTSRSAVACTAAPVRRSARAETQRRPRAYSGPHNHNRLAEAEHGPAGARRYNYMPTYILRGLTELHLEFDVR